MVDDKYIEMLKLSAQIELCQELPYQTVFKADSKLNDLKMKSAVLMDDLVDVLNQKRERLALLNGTKTINKLNKQISEQSETIERLQSKLMKNYRFYKEDPNWYVDLPEWKGAKSDLLMIGGADTMLDIISKNGTEVNTTISLEEFEGSSKLEYQKDAKDDIGEGAYYLLSEYDGKKLDLSVFLCDVTLFVFGEFPKQIFIKVS